MLLALAVTLASLVFSASQPGVIIAKSDGPTFFCGSTFTFPILVGERVSPTVQAGTHVLSMKAGDFAFREIETSAPPGAKPVWDKFGVKVYPVTQGGRVAGYLLSVEGQRLTTVVMGNSFTGTQSDFDILSRFNFHPDRPLACRADDGAVRKE